MGVRPFPPSSPLATHQDFAERNGFCTRSFFIIKLTVSTPSSRPRLLPGEDTPPFLGVGGVRVNSLNRPGGALARPESAPHLSVFLGRIRPQSLEHAPSDQGAAEVQAVIAQQQFVVAQKRVRRPAEAEPGAQQARAGLEVRDGDEPPEGPGREEKGRGGDGWVIAGAPSPAFDCRNVPARSLFVYPFRFLNPSPRPETPPQPCPSTLTGSF